MLNTIFIPYIFLLITLIVTQSKSLSTTFYTLIVVSLFVFMINLNYLAFNYLNFIMLNLILIILGSVELIFIIYTLSKIN